MTLLDDKVAGDVGDTFIITLQDAGVAVDLTTATGVECHVTPAAGGTSVDLATTITDAANGKITVQLAATSAGWLAAVATPGTYYLEYEVTFSATNVRTWPSGDRNSFKVRAQSS